jgi:hypothetical protein
VGPASSLPGGLKARPALGYKLLLILTPTRLIPVDRFRRGALAIRAAVAYESRHRVRPAPVPTDAPAPVLSKGVSLMTKTMAAMKRRTTLLALGGSSLALLGSGFPGLSSCSIAAVSDGVLNDNVANSDYDTIIREPVTDFFQALWSNWVWMQFPRDPSVVNVAVE